MSARFARFVVRPGYGDGSVPLLGFNHGLFREGVVYEATEVMGEIVLREVGPSPLGLPPQEATAQGLPSNGADHNRLLTNAAFVMTLDELRGQGK